MAKKNRVEIPGDIVADILFRSNRTCCVCREKKPVQIHHVNEDPANYNEDNLAVLCFDCHRDTQIQGGFDRKLNSALIQRYRKDWLERIANKRDRDHGPLIPHVQSGKMLQIRAVKHVQMEESSEDHLYSIDVEYPQLSSDDAAISEELNRRIIVFITNLVDDFRAAAISQTEAKLQMRRELSAMGWDSLSIVHKIWLLTPDYLSIEFVVQSYGAGAAHPNSVTRTLNFRLRPFKQMELSELFKPASSYLQALSEYCIGALHKLQPPRWYDPRERAEQLELHRDDWITTGTAPIAKNFSKFVLVNEGITVFFDPYEVGSYAEGRYEVFVPFQFLELFLTDKFYQKRP